MIDGWKNRGLTPDKVPQAEGYAYGNGLGAKLYADYQARLKIINAADFGDLLLEPLRMFQENPDVLKTYQERFKYMLVDEYQDTNIAQYLWLRLLAQGHKNICCVGDDDQSIYGWRGAEVDNILRFEKDFPGAKVIRLEQNYRSTPDILGAASGLIAKNESRLGKTLHTTKNETEKIKLRGHWDSEEEARTVGDDIESLYSKANATPTWPFSCAPHSKCASFEDRFITLGLPYRVVGGPRFYERAEIRDAVAYLAVVLSPDNDLKFERIINTPKRGIGDASIKKMYDVARASGTSLYAAATSMLAIRRTAQQGPHISCACCSKTSPAGVIKSMPCRKPNLPKSSSMNRATPRCGRTIKAPRPKANSKTSKNSCAPWASLKTSQASWNTLAWSWTATRARTPTRSTS